MSLSRNPESKAKTVADLQAVTGLGRYAVIEGIKRGELPGYKVGARYTIPSEAFQRFVRGEWQPDPKPITPIVQPQEPPRSLVQRRSS